MAQVPLNSISTIQSYGPRPSSMPSLPNAAGRAVAAGARVYDTAISIEQDKLRRRLGDINDKYKRRAEAINGIVKGINIAVDGYTNAVRIEERRANREAEEALNELSRRMNRQFYGYVDEETGAVHKGIKDMPFTEMSNGEFGQKANNPVLATIRAYKDFADSDYYKSMSQNGQKAFQRGVNATMASYLKEAEQLTIAGLQKQKEYIRAQKAQNAANEIKAASSFINVESGIYDQRLYDNLYLMVYSPYEQNGQIKLKRDESGNAILDPEHIEFVGSEELQEATRQELDADVKKYFHVMNGVMFDNVANEYVNTDDDEKAQRIESFLWNFVLSGTTVSNKKETMTVDGQDVEVTVPGCDATELAAWIAEGKDTAWYSAKQVELGVKRLNGLQEERRSRMEKEDETTIKNASYLVTDFLLSDGNADAKDTMEKVGKAVGSLKQRTPEERQTLLDTFSDRMVAPELARLVIDLNGEDVEKRDAAWKTIQESSALSGAYERRYKRTEQARKTPFSPSKEDIKAECDNLETRSRNATSTDDFDYIQSRLYQMFEDGYITPEEYRKRMERVTTNISFTQICRTDRVREQRENTYIGLVAQHGFDAGELKGLLQYDESGVPVLNTMTGAFTPTVKRESRTERQEMLYNILEALRKFDVLSIREPDNPLLFDENGKKMTIKEYADVVLSGEITQLKNLDILDRVNSIASRLYSLNRNTPIQLQEAEHRVSKETKPESKKNGED